MGSDNQFIKPRKSKNTKSLARRKSKRQSYDKVLIVCEGEKTEPLYLEGARIHYGLASTNIKIAGRGTDPASIFSYAKECFDRERNMGDPYDRVYCVFDKDVHHSYADAINSIQTARSKTVYFVIPSVPCFEFWFLLHYRYTTSPYNPLPGRSSCDQIIAELEKFIPGYKKGNRNLFLMLLENLDIAKTRAAKVCDQVKVAQTDNPSTKVHELVIYLQNIKSK